MDLRDYRFILTQCHLANSQRDRIDFLHSLFMFFSIEEIFTRVKTKRWRKTWKNARRMRIFLFACSNSLTIPSHHKKERKRKRKQHEGTQKIIVAVSLSLSIYQIYHIISQQSWAQYIQSLRVCMHYTIYCNLLSALQAHSFLPRTSFGSWRKEFLSPWQLRIFDDDDDDILSPFVPAAHITIQLEKTEQ